MIKERPMNTSPPAVRGGRRVWLKGGILLVAALAALAVTVAIGDRDSRPGVQDNGFSEGSSRGDSSAGAEAKMDGELGQAEGLADADGPSGPNRKGAQEASAVGSGADFNSLFVVGKLGDGGRLLAVPAAELVRLASHKAPGGDDFPIVGMSQIVGNALTVASVGEYVVASATNHAQLVRLDRNLGGLKTLSLKTTVAAVGEVWYGAMVPVEDDRVLVSLATGSKVAVVDIDVPNWTIRRQAVFEDRFGNFPRLCRAGERLFLSSLERVDVLSMELERIASALVGSRDLGLVCGGRSAWASGAEAPELLEVTASGKLGRTLKWEGRGAAQLTFDASTETIFGSDQAIGKVFACELRGRCRVGGRLGNKPTDLLVQGDHLFVAVEGTRAIGVLLLDSLEILGTVPFPGRPRALAPLGLS